MAKLILTYRLKSGVSHETYQEWVRTVDYPTMRGIARISAFATHHVTKRLMGGADAPLPFEYMELFDIPDLDGFASQDMAGSVVQTIMGDFMTKVDNVEFLVADTVA
jgi:REDY-like protein HapK